MPDGEKNQGVRIEPSFNLGSYSLGKRIPELEPRVLGEIEAEPLNEQYLEGFREQRYRELFEVLNSGEYFKLKDDDEANPANYFNDIKDVFTLLCIKKYKRRGDILPFLKREQVGSLIAEVGKAVLDIQKPIEPIRSKKVLKRREIGITNIFSDMTGFRDGDIVYYHGLNRTEYGDYDHIPESYIKKTIRVNKADTGLILELREEDSWPWDIFLAGMHPDDLKLAHRLKKAPKEIESYMYNLIPEKKPEPEPEPVAPAVPEEEDLLSQFEN